MREIKSLAATNKPHKGDAAIPVFLHQLAVLLIWLAVLTVDLYSPTQPPNEPPQQGKELWEL